MSGVRIGKAFGYIDTSGSMKIPPRCADAKAFRDGLAAVSVDGKWGLIDRSGSFVVKPVFDYDKGLPSAPIFFEGKACVKIDGKFGFIDKTGRPLFPPRFIKCAGFRGVCRLGFVQVTFRPFGLWLAHSRLPSGAGSSFSLWSRWSAESILVRRGGLAP